MVGNNWDAYRWLRWVEGDLALCIEPDQSGFYIRMED